MGNRLSKIVTKTGDKGMTSFGGGCSLISKGHPAIELIGAIDELNAHVGLVKANMKGGGMHHDIQTIQQTLFNMGAEVFMSNPERIYVAETDVELLETLIGAMAEKLPPLKEFVLPGANVISAHVHIARTVCRRAEATAWRYLESRDAPPQYVRYLNRLSDFLFVLARAETGRSEETLWVGGRKK